MLSTSFLSFIKKEQLTEKQINLNPLETILTSLTIHKPQFIEYYKE